MVMTRQSRVRRRRRTRGAAMFVVMLVVALLSGLGLFAVREATLSVQASGYGRQMTQTHYIADYAVLSVAGDLATDRRQGYAEMMASGKDTACAHYAAVDNATCMRVTYDSVNHQIQQYNSTMTLLEPQSGGNPPIPGSLGAAPIEGDMLVELTDLGPASPPVAGMNLGDPGNSPQFMALTMSALGQTRPTPAVQGQCDIVSTTSMGIEQSRAHVVIGPIVPPAPAQ
jgi:hypothetical protein